MDIINVGFLRWIWTNRAYPSSFPLDCSLPLSFCFVFVFQDRVSLCNSPDCSGTLLVDQASLKLTDLPASASWVLRLRCMPPHPASYLPLIQLGFYGVVHLVFFFFSYIFSESLGLCRRLSLLGLLSAWNGSLIAGEQGVSENWQTDTRECAGSECNLSNWASNFLYRRK